MTRHVLARGHEDDCVDELRDHAHVDCRVRDDLLLDAVLRLARLQFRVGELPAHVKVSDGDRDSCEGKW